MRGSLYGSELLSSIGQFLKIQSEKDKNVISLCHLDSDHFAVCIKDINFNPEEIFPLVLKNFEKFAPRYNITFSYGIVRIDNSEDISACCDKAYTALRTTKEFRDVAYAWYDQRWKKNPL